MVDDKVPNGQWKIAGVRLDGFLVSYVGVAGGARVGGDLWNGVSVADVVVVVGCVVFVM